MDREVYRAVTDHFKQDIREFFVRSNFYLATEVLLFYGFFQFSVQRVPGTPLEFSLTTGIAIAGLVVAVFWWVAASGAVIWIDRWREEVRRLDDKLDRFHSYSKTESTVLEHQFQSPERITQYLPVFFLFIWLADWGVVLLAWMGRI